MSNTLNEIDKLEVITLQDNYIDLVPQDDTDVVKRAKAIQDMEMKNTILAEHGFSSIVTATRGDKARSILFDFGFSSYGAAFNADSLNADLTGIEACVLSHGHMDHFGGLTELIKKTGKRGLEFVAHPEVFRESRFLKTDEGLKIKLPAFTRKAVKQAGLALVETEKPYQLLDGDILFLGSIPRITDFEKGASNLFYHLNGEEKWDDLPDDSAIAANVKGKGLVVISGCAHSGIINTIRHARKISSFEKIFAVMGGFHLGNAPMETVVKPTVKELKEIDPIYIIPTHCTGRAAVMKIEKEMRKKFILNMSGTTLTFAA